MKLKTTTKTYNPLSEDKAVETKEVEINIGQTFERLALAIGYAKENDISKGQLTERLRSILLRVHSHLDEICNMIDSQIDVDGLKRKAREELAALMAKATEGYKYLDEHIGKISVATEDFHALVTRMVPADGEVHDATEFIDIPFDVNCPDFTFAERLLKFCIDLQNNIEIVMKKNLPHVHRGRLIVGKSIREFLLSVANSRGIAGLAKAAKLNRVTLYKWMGMNADTMELEMEKFEYAYPKYLISLADATNHKINIIEGVAEFIPDDPDDSVPTIEDTARLSVMIDNSITLKKLMRNKPDDFQMVLAGRSNLGTVEEIWKRDNLDAKVAEKRHDLIQDVKKTKQIEDATELGLIKVVMFDELNDVGVEAATEVDNSDLFTPNPIPSKPSEDMFAIKLDTHRFFFNRRFNLPYGCTVTCSISEKPTNRRFILFNLKEAHGDGSTEYRFGVYHTSMSGDIMIETVDGVLEDHPEFSEDDTSYEQCKLGFKDGLLISDSRYTSGEHFETSWNALPVLGDVFTVVDVRL